MNDKSNFSSSNIFAVIVIVVVLAGSALYLYADNSKTRTDTPQPTSTPSEARIQTTANYITIKYRSSQVDVANPRFEYLDTSGSSLVRGAWYDDSKKYMIINLNGTNYHYCGLPLSTWNEFKAASSFGSFYNSDIKGNFDCRGNPVPIYE
jgi:hypothetical protein